MADFGSILSGIGTAAGGLSKLFGGGGDGIDVSENYRLNMAMQDLIPRGQNLTVGGMKMAAKKHGFHPMYLMGSAGNWSPTVVSGSKKQTDWASAMQGIGEGLGQVGRALTKEEKQIDVASKALGLRQQNAEVLSSEYRAELLYNDLMRDRASLNAERSVGSEPSTPSPRPKPKPPDPMRPGLVDEERVYRPDTKIPFMGGTADVSGLTSPEVAEEAYDEAGATLQGLYNVYQSWKRGVERRYKRQQDEKRKKREQRYEQHKKRGGHHRYPFGESGKRRIYKW